MLKLSGPVLGPEGIFRSGVGWKEPGPRLFFPKRALRSGPLGTYRMVIAATEARERKRFGMSGCCVPLISCNTEALLTVCRTRTGCQLFRDVIAVLPLA